MFNFIKKLLSKKEPQTPKVEYKQPHSEYTLNELTNWMQEAVKRGRTIENAKAKLLKHGCKPSLIETAVQKVEKTPKPKPVIQLVKKQEQPHSEYSLDEITNWINSAVKKGRTIEQAKAKLLKHGCKPPIVELATQKIQLTEQKKSDKRAIITVISLLIIIGLIITGLILIPKYIKKPKLCQDIDCFLNRMTKCSPTELYHEEKEASWLYGVLNKQNNECIVQVTLLQAKEGELRLTQLHGLSMQCNYPLHISVIPGKDLGICNGRLKEELQEIIIEKLHTNIIENLGIIDQSLNT